MPFSFVVSEVVRPVRIDARHVITLSFKLQRNAPRTLSPAAKQELATLKRATDALNADVSTEVTEESRPADMRPLVWSTKKAWGTLHQRIETLATFEADDVAEVEQAKAVIAGAFASGLAFLASDNETLWLGGQHTLDAIKRLELTETVEALAGAYVLRVVRERHHALGLALGLAGSVRPTGEEVATPVVDRRALLDAVTASIARYAGHLVAIDINDAAAVAAAERALEPLVKHRAKAKANRADDGASDDEGSNEETPTPARPAPVTGGAANDTDAAKRNVA